MKQWDYYIENKNKWNWDIDSSINTWANLYRNTYVDNKSFEKFNFNVPMLMRISKKGTPFFRIYINGQYTNEKYDNYIIRMAGDCDFGTAIYSNRECPKEFEDSMHKLYNFSFCPIDGGMNAAKGSIYKDVFPFYLYRLKEFYKTNDIKPLVNKCGRMNDEEWNRQQEVLKLYLNKFSSFNNYCKNVFFFGYKINDIDKTLISDMLSFAKNNINKDKKNFDYDGYEKLAFRYWNVKKTILEKIGIVEN